MNSIMTNFYKKNSKNPARQSVSAGNSRHCSPLRTFSNPSSPFGKKPGDGSSDCFIIDRTGDRKTPGKDKKSKSAAVKTVSDKITDREDAMVVVVEDSSSEKLRESNQPINESWIQTDGSGLNTSNLSHKDAKVDVARKRPKDTEKQASKGEKESESTKTEKLAKKKSKSKDKEEESKKSGGPVVQQSQVKFADIGGNDATLKVQLVIEK